ncbi:hypothetical protein B0H19DRAFT_1020239 [Mycena capillaripes]|nr:hypothetical protein B0H19DRAFT_1020239 [Mycena capillaripes]
MALPETYTMIDISGKYTLNKSLSDSDASNAILEQQGVGLLKRKAMDFAGATICIRHYKDAEGVEHMEVEPQIPGKSPAKEVRVLDWTEKSIDHPLFGNITTKSRRVKPAELDDEHLKKGWSAETVEGGVIQLHVVGKDNWTAIQIWGIEEINGERRHTRHITFTGPKGNTIHARLVYDYVAI